MSKQLRTLYDNENAVSFLICMLIFGISGGLNSGSLNNYLHEVLAISQVERGIVEFPRELPGLLLMFIIAILSRFSELKVMNFALLISMTGMIGLGFVGDTRTMAIVSIILFSTGEHMLMPIKQSVAMHMARNGKEGLAMGGVSSLENIGQLIGQYTIPVLFLIVGFIIPGVSVYGKFRHVFLLAAIVLFGAFVIASRIRETHGHIERKKIYFRKKFTKYYILEMFFGARKQVFLTFAPYVLVLNYGAKTEYVAFLYGLWSFINIFLGPLMGRLIDRLGYKLIIVIDTIVLVGLCFLYGFSHRLFPHPIAFAIISVVFVLDAILFMVGMARAVYVKSISNSKAEITTVLSTGVSINHVVSIAIAIAGGIIWQKIGIEGLFSLAAVFGIGSFLFALTLPSPSTISAIRS
ncbi:MFS transporter [candidate division KSB1 bacterium]|nr:MFS transporter [candidate division KSB1 bacterium]